MRATTALAGAYLKRRDQVGLLSFGGSVNWLEPALGTVQLYRIVEALLDTEVVLSYIWRDIRVIPTHVLPPKALVLGLTPLLDERMVDALVNVRGRGADVAALEIAPEPFIRVGRGRAGAARVSDLEAAPRRRAQPLPPPRCPRRRVAPRRSARARAGGGVGIQALRQGDARVVAGIAAAVCAALFALAVWLSAADHPDPAAVGVLAGLGLVAGGLVLRRGTVLTVGLALLGVGYGAALIGKGLDPAAGLFAAGLVAVAELAFWAIEPGAAVPLGRAATGVRVLVVGSIVLGSALVGTVLLVVVSDPIRGEAVLGSRRRPRGAGDLRDSGRFLRDPCAAASARVAGRWPRCFRRRRVFGA